MKKIDTPEKGLYLVEGGSVTRKVCTSSVDILLTLFAYLVRSIYNRVHHAQNQ